MTAIINSKVVINRGKSRVWVEGRKLEREGFSVDKRYDVKVREASVALMLSEDSKYIVSKRTRNSRTSPIIDLNGSVVSDNFEIESLIRIVVNGDKVVISIHHSIKLQDVRDGC